MKNLPDRLNGKLEIPGIQKDDLLTIVLDNLIQILKPYICDGDLHYLHL